MTAGGGGVGMHYWRGQLLPFTNSPSFATCPLESTEGLTCCEVGGFLCSLLGSWLSLVDLVDVFLLLIILCYRVSR